MTDPGTQDTGNASGGDPAPPGGPARGGEGPGEPVAGPPRRRRRWLRWAALGTSVLVLGATGAAWSVYQKLDGNIRTDVDTAAELDRYAAQRPAPVVHEAENILLLGSDSRSGKNGKYGRDGGGQRSDTVILLHLSADRTSATGVSIPRDLMTEIPSCTTRGGERSEAEFAQFNGAFQTGGAACTIRTVEKMTGIRIDHHLILDFQGFKKLVDAVDGVEVCLPEAVSDADAQLDLPAGRQTLHGEDALGYVRARHGLGNGSDTQRMERQQQFLASLVKKMRSNGVLLNPAKLYPVLDSATSALTADSGLDSLSELYELVRGLRNIPEENVRFLTVPRESYELDINRDQLVQPAADELFAQLREDRPVQVDEDGGGSDGGKGEGRDAGGSGGKGVEKAEPAGRSPGSGTAEPGSPGADGSGAGGGDGGADGKAPGRSGDGSGENGPTYRGTTAARDICAGDAPENGVN